MKHCLSFFGLFFLSAMAMSQQDTNFLYKQYRNRLQLERKASLVLGGWGLANTITGVIGTSNTSGSDKYFHQMNLGWGIVNTGLAFLMRGTAGKKMKTPVAAAGTILKEQNQVEKILLLNTGLDLGYMAIGWGMKEKSKSTNNKPERLEGFGKSLLLQGGFLLAFDAVQYLLHRKQGRQIENWLDGMTLVSTNNGVGIVYRWH